ncbi:MAG: class I SAM-dependent methyltransferase [bacterium]
MNTITSIIKRYLRERPYFYAYLRPQEALLFYERINKMRGPILDFGCGDGFFASTFYRKKFIDVGIDLPSSRIGESLKTQVYIQITKYDGHVIPFASKTFGTIVSNCVFEHVPHIAKSMREMYRVTKNDGLIMTTVMCTSWSNNLFGGKIFGKKYVNWFNKMQHHDSLLSKKEWIYLFSNAGFDVVESVDYLYEKAAHKIELHHFLSVFSLFTYILFKKWRVFPFVLQGEINEIKKLIAEDKRNPSACFFVLKKVNSS